MILECSFPLSFSPNSQAVIDGQLKLHKGVERERERERERRRRAGKLQFEFKSPPSLLMYKN